MENLVYVGDIPIATDKQMRPRDADDFYETDPNCLRAYFEQYDLDLDGKDILDPGAGTGAYGRALRERFPYTLIFGVEKHGERFGYPRNDYGPPAYNRWFVGDYLEMDAYPRFAAVIGNPPYRHAEAFFWRSLLHLENGTGTIDFLLRLGFAESERRYKSMWSNGHRPSKITVLNTRPSFTGDGKTYPAAFAFFRWDIVNGVCDERREIDFLVYERSEATCAL